MFTFIYYFDLCFTLSQEYFTYTPAASITVGGNKAVSQGEPTTIRRLLKVLPTYRQTESQQELNFSTCMATPLVYILTSIVANLPTKVLQTATGTYTCMSKYTCMSTYYLHYMTLLAKVLKPLHLYLSILKTLARLITRTEICHVSSHVQYGNAIFQDRQYTLLWHYRYKVWYRQLSTYK